MYTIHEVSKKYDLTYDALRYYEKEGLIPEISRNSQGQREYSDNDLSEINKLVHLRKLGASVDDCKKIMSLFKNPNPTAQDYQNGINFLNQLDKDLDDRISEIQQQKQFLANKTARFKSELDKLTESNSIKNN